jgi:hypothetical protein
MSNSYRINLNSDEIHPTNNIIANNQSNVFLIDLNKQSLRNINKQINSSSNAKEKLIISLNYYK